MPPRSSNIRTPCMPPLAIVTQSYSQDTLERTGTKGATKRVLASFVAITSSLPANHYVRKCVGQHCDRGTFRFAMCGDVRAWEMYNMYCYNLYRAYACIISDMNQTASLHNLI